jgi:hypothetical protein
MCLRCLASWIALTCRADPRNRLEHRYRQCSPVDAIIHTWRCPKAQSSNEFEGVQVSWTELKWVQVTSNEFRWVQMSSSEFKWVQMSPSECKWIQMSSNECKWTQVSSSEFKWVQMTWSDFGWAQESHLPPIPAILLSNFTWPYR